MQNNQGNRSHNCVSELFTTLGRWCYGPDNTEAGQIARVMAYLSGTFIFGGSTFYFIYNNVSDNNKMEHSKSYLLFSCAATTLFSFGILSCIVAPIIGHRFCNYGASSVHSDQNTTTIETEMSVLQEDYESFSNSVTLPPSYDEAMELQQVSVVMAMQNNHIRS